MRFLLRDSLLCLTRLRNLLNMTSGLVTSGSFSNVLWISADKMDSIKETEQSRYNGVEGRKQSIKKLHLHQMKYPLLDAWLK